VSIARNCAGSEASDVDDLVVFKNHIRSGQPIYLHQGILFRNLPCDRDFNEDHQFWKHIWERARCWSEVLRTFTIGTSRGSEYADY
jgi:hypothetical protein